MSNGNDGFDELEEAERRLAEKARALKAQASGYAVLHSDDMRGALAVCFRAFHVMEEATEEGSGGAEAYSLAFDTIEGVLALMLAIGHTCATGARDISEAEQLARSLAPHPHPN